MTWGVLGRDCTEGNSLPQDEWLRGAPLVEWITHGRFSSCASLPGMKCTYSWWVGLPAPMAASPAILESSAW